MSRSVEKKDIVFTIRLSKSEKLRLDLECAKRGCSPVELIRSWIHRLPTPSNEVDPI